MLRPMYNMQFSAWQQVKMDASNLGAGVQQKATHDDARWTV